jgi:hypothetical protein
MTEKEILHAMKTLDLTREEAIEMLQEDAEIDHGADPHPLTPEQEKVSKAARIVSTGPRATPVKRERKPNEDKRELIAAIEEMLTYSDIQAEGVTITNPERQIDFEFHGNRYRIVLSAPRK